MSSLHVKTGRPAVRGFLALALSGVMVAGFAVGAHAQEPQTAPAGKAVTGPFGPSSGGTALTLNEPIKFTQIAASDVRSNAISDTGDLYAWGSLAPFAGGALSSTADANPVFDLDKSGYSSITAGGTHMYGVIGNEVYTWGFNDYGQTGMGSGSDSWPSPPAAKATRPRISVNSPATFAKGDILKPGQYTSSLVNSDGDIYVWGLGSSGQFGDGEAKPAEDTFRTYFKEGKPVIRPLGQKFVDVDIQNKSAIAATDTGNVYAWGSNDKGQFGNGAPDTQYHPSPVLVMAGAGIKKVAANGGYSIALSATGVAYIWGTPLGGSLIKQPTKLQNPQGVKFKSVSAGSISPVFLGDDGNIYSMGTTRNWIPGTKAALGTDYVSEPIAVKRPAEVKKFIDVKVGRNGALALGDNGQLYNWGSQEGFNTPIVAVWETGVSDVGSSADVPKMVKVSSITSVKFGNTEATSFKSNDNGTFTATAPKHTAGPVDVTVTYKVRTAPDAMPADPPVWKELTKTYKDAFTFVEASTISNPIDQVVDPGKNAVFSVKTTGYPVPTVVWEQSKDNGKTWTELTGAGTATATGSELTVKAGPDTDGSLFRATASNGEGDPAVSKTATLTVNHVSATVSDPEPQTVAPGKQATFEVKTTGYPVPNVVWEQSVKGSSEWTPVTDAVTTTATGSKVTVTGTTENSGTQFRATASNGSGDPVTSKPALLTVSATAVTITNPAPKTVAPGQQATFEVETTGTPAPTVVWEQSTDESATWTPVTSGVTATAHGSKLTVTASAQNTGTQFRATASNSAGDSVTSKSALLTVSANAPTITDPAAQTVAAGQAATFEVKTTGTPAPKVVWEQAVKGSTTWTPVTDGVTATATGSKLTVTGTAQNTGTQFRATASNGAGDSVTSKPALLTVSATTGPGKVSRIAGASRYETAANVSKASFTKTGGTVFLANGAGLPDALAAAPVAGHEESPVLLVEKDNIPAPTNAELSRLKPAKVVLLGGTGVISDAMIAKVKSVTGAKTVERWAGSDRYSTAAEVAKKAFPGKVDTVYIAGGEGLPDALAAAPVAGMENAPILLTGAKALPQVTKDRLKVLAPKKIVVLGGTGVVAPALEAQLKQAAGSSPQVTRWAGSNRYATAANVASQAFTGGADTVYVSGGAGLPDALAGAPVASMKHAPILLTAQGVLSPESAAALQALVKKQQIHQIVVLGGTGSVSDAVLKQLQGYVK